MTDRRYPSMRTDPRELRPRRSNALAAVLLLGFLVVIVVLIALAS